MSDDMRKGRVTASSTSAPPAGPPDRDRIVTGVIAASGKQVIDPPVDPLDAMKLAWWSPDLQAARPSLVNSVHGFGQTIEPFIDLSGDSEERGRSQVREILERKKLHEIMDQAEPDEDPFDALDDEELVSDNEVDRVVRSLRRRQQAETAHANRFFNRVYPEGGLKVLRDLLGQDRYEHGGYWLGVSRDQRGVIARFSRLPVHEMRFTAEAPIATLFRRWVRDGLGGRSLLVYSRFARLIVQVKSGRPVRYYREFGDSRFVDANSGRIFVSETEFRQAQRESRGQGHRRVELAVEVLFVGKVRPASAPYAVPDHWPARLVIETSIKADQVKDQHFANPRPHVILAVAGGTVPGDHAQTLSDGISEKNSGVRNFDNLTIVDGINADPAVASRNPDYGGGVAKITSIVLPSAMPADMFVGMSEANELTTGATTGVPPLLRSRDKDVNRNSAREQERIFQSRIVQPEQSAAWDDPMNTFVLPEIGICSVRVVSNGPTLTTDADRNDELRKGVESSILHPNDARTRYRVGDQPFEQLPLDPTTPWVSTPPAYAKLLSDEVALVPGGTPIESQDDDSDDASQSTDDEDSDSDEEVEVEQPTEET